MTTSTLIWQWGLVIVSSVILYAISPLAATRESFFAGLSRARRQPGVVMLTLSLVISWIFAKSITNAANLGLSFGIVGGVAYATYYLSFLVAGIIIYRIRTSTNAASLPDFLAGKFGRAATIAFAILISIRLFNEVWSNTAVIGSYFGDQGTFGYIASIVVFTGLTLGYSLKGGLRSSLITDVIQMALFGILLFVVLGIIIPRQGSVTTFFTTGDWTLATGVNLLLVALLQVFSYPFHDPVMTDRGFISDRRTTLKSFLWAGAIGFVCITLFSFVGIHARVMGLEGQAAVEVSRTFGVGMMLVMNFIMITSAASTLDSTFSSVAKLVVVDVGDRKKVSISRGRIVMIITAVAGSLPLFLAPKIISATTISGTMVLGLAPIFVFWKMQVPRLSYFLALGVGLFFGLLLVLGLIPEWMYVSDGKYADLLAANIYGTIFAFAGFLLPRFFWKGTQASQAKPFGAPQN